jgi:hypothetical protein
MRLRPVLIEHGLVSHPWLAGCVPAVDAGSCPASHPVGDELLQAGLQLIHPGQDSIAFLQTAWALAGDGVAGSARCFTRIDRVSPAAPAR